MNNLHEAFEELDYLPQSWVESFVPQLKEELCVVLGEYVQYFQILQCKEKYNELRIYWCFEVDDGTTDEDIINLNLLFDSIENIINKYTKISRSISIFK